MATKNTITAIRVLSNCRATSGGLVAGKTYQVPKDVSVRDAGILIGMRRAEDATGADTVSLEAFTAAIANLEAGNTDQWTNGGLPDVGALKSIGGLASINAAQRDALWSEYQKAQV